MIKLCDKNRKTKLYSNKKGMQLLRKANPTEQFRIAVCDYTFKKVVQVYSTISKEWICLHD